MAGIAAFATPPKSEFTYEFYGGKPTDLIYQGDAHFPTDTTYLRLTKTDSGSWGRVIHPEPVLLWKPNGQANFATTVKFTIKPKSSNDIPADGLTFFMVPVAYSFPAFQEGGDLGIYDGAKSSPLLAVEVDIFANQWDPPFIHLGINTQSRVSQNVAQIPLSFIGKEVTLTISYASPTGIISAILTSGTQTIQATHQCDLQTILPQQVQVGLSGSTGPDFVAKHDVAFWKFQSDLLTN